MSDFSVPLFWRTDDSERWVGEAILELGPGTRMSVKRYETTNLDKVLSDQLNDSSLKPVLDVRQRVDGIDVIITGFKRDRDAQTVDVVYYTRYGRHLVGKASVKLNEKNGLSIEVVVTGRKHQLTAEDVMDALVGIPTELVLERSE